MKKLKIVHDSTPTNPFKDWDGCIPLMYESGHGNADFSDGEIVSHVIDSITDGQIIRHQRTLMDMLDLYAEDYEEYTKEEKIDEIRHEMHRADMDTITELCEMFKIPHLVHQSTGYSQGDYAKVLIVPTDEFFKLTGAPRKGIEKQMQETAELFDAWAWGDVYGFQVIEVTKCEDCGEEHEEEIDSCYGFYGSNFETNGMKDYLPEELHER